MADQGKSWETTCTVALKYYNYLYVPNKTLPKTSQERPYKNRIPPAPEVSLCSEVARSQVLWSVLSLSKSALSLSAVNSLCVRFHSLSSITKNQLPVPTCGKRSTAPAADAEALGRGSYSRVSYAEVGFHPLQ